ncbi:MAG TPA: hypothetical protein VGO00_13995 [Kofleriaceae bacterium]|nr:hypothetical protein [Kofleriaceae bacterium]
MSVSAARSRVTQARSQLETNRLDDVETTLEAAMKFLAGETNADTAPVIAEIEKIRAEFAAMLKPADRTKISAAEGKIRQAKSQIDSGYKAEDVEVTLRSAGDFLAGVPDGHAEPVRAKIAEVRASLGSSAAPPPPPRPVIVDDRASGARPASDARTDAPVRPAPTMSEDAARDLTRAKSRILQARSFLESRQLDRVDGALVDAAGYLANVPDSFTAAGVADIAAIRAKLVEAAHADEVRKITSILDRDLGSADSSITVNIHHTTALLAHVAEILAADDTRRVFAADGIVAYQTRADAIRTRLAAHVKSDGLSRAHPLLDDLEARLVSDPFVGLDQRAAYVITHELRYLEGRIRTAIRGVPDDDDTKAIEARLAIVDAKIDAASVAWGKAVVDAEVGNSWAAIAKDIEGWEQETGEAGRPLEDPVMPKTRLAIRRVRYLLDDPQTQKIRDDHKGDATIETTYRTAIETLDAAAAKLDAAFNRVLDHADTMETPLRRFELDRPAQLAGAADYAFAGTRYHDANVARARKLDDRWKADVAAIMKARQDLYDRLAAEADVTWPAIMSAVSAAELDPHTATRGTTVVLTGVYNRSGWDFDGGDYAFAMRQDGIPIGGHYEPKVLAALEHAWYELKLDVSDRIPWDLIAVVDGKSTIGVRTTITLKSKSTGLEIGKLEEFRPAECVELRIIGLRAGPVAVGP